MEDLIRREDAIKAIEERDIIIKGMRYSKTIFIDYNKKMRDGMVDILRTVPSVDAKDAKDVKHGWWKTIGKTNSGSIIRECSCCGIKRKGQAKTPYCPYCGAELNPCNAKEQQIPGQTSLYK